MWLEQNHWKRISSNVLRENVVQCSHTWLMLSYHQCYLMEKNTDPATLSPLSQGSEGLEWDPGNFILK